MDYFAGLDVSAKETSVCIVDDVGRIVRSSRSQASQKLFWRFCGTPPTTSSAWD
jgi:transposase